MEQIAKLRAAPTMAVMWWCTLMLIAILGGLRVLSTHQVPDALIRLVITLTVLAHSLMQIARLGNLPVSSINQPPAPLYNQIAAIVEYHITNVMLTPTRTIASGIMEIARIAHVPITQEQPSLMLLARRG